MRSKTINESSTRHSANPYCKYLPLTEKCNDCTLSSVCQHWQATLERRSRQRKQTHGMDDIPSPEGSQGKAGREGDIGGGNRAD